MAITYPLSLPSINPSSVRFIAHNNTATATSPFSGAQQVYEHPAQWWEAEVSYAAMSHADAEGLVAVLTALKGMFGTFLLGDPYSTSVQGVGTGTPVVNGASQTGSSLVTDGWTASKTGILKAGDWIQLGSGTSQHIYKILQDANSDSGGNATFDIWPTLRASPADDATITIANTKGVFRLQTNDWGYNLDSVPHYGITFAAREAL